jgi:hypothetical protein
MKPDITRVGKQAVDDAIREFVTLGRYKFLEKYNFGKARSYFVIDPNTHAFCDSKAIVGAAYGYQFPSEGPLRPRDFSGGDATVVRLLRQLGFSLVDDESAEDIVHSAWAHYENELIVADYLKMLSLELAGQKYNKAKLARDLVPLLNQRSVKSIEFKRANISAVMIDLGFPSLAGYKPRSHYQEGLIDIVADQVDHFEDLEKAVQLAVEMPANVPETVSFDAVLVNPPKHQKSVCEAPASRARRPTKRDYLERESRNRSLGHAGEKFILQYERWRLSTLGVGQLAERVEHVSETQGDGLGYDILSFEIDGRERYVEVKTTAHDPLTPFYVSANEVEFARESGDRFCLSRVFNFRRNPSFFELRGPVENHCDLDVATFRASF